MTFGLSRRDACKLAALAGAGAALPFTFHASPALAEKAWYETEGNSLAWFANAADYPQPTNDAVWDTGWKLRRGDDGALVPCSDAGFSETYNAHEAVPARWAYDAVRLPQAWALCPGTPGAGVTVGVFDTAVFFDHEDIPEPVSSWQEDEPEGGWAEKGHGTRVAGIIAARASNGTGAFGGTVGVAYGSGLVNCSYNIVEDQLDSGHLDGYPDADGALLFETGIKWLVRERGARVINCSNGLYNESKQANEGDEDSRALIVEANARLADTLSSLLDDGFDFVICKASGNYNSKTGPFGDEGFEGGQDARYDLLSGIEDERLSSRIIVVGGAEPLCDGSCRAAGFSAGGDRVDVVAPGLVYCTSTVVPAWQSNLGEDTVGSAYSTGTGCSFASPIVAGVAALVWSANSGLTGDQVKRIVCGSASVQVGYSAEAASEIRNFDGGATYPFVDAEAAVRAALEAGGDWPYGTYSYVAMAGGYRSALAVDAAGVLTWYSYQSASPVYSVCRYQMARDDSVDASPLGEGALAFRLTPAGAGEEHDLQRDAAVVTATFDVTAEEILGYVPAADVFYLWDSFFGEWGAEGWTRS